MKPTIFLIIILLICLLCSSCQTSINVEDSVILPVSEDVSKALQIAIEDDIWFWGESSIFHPFINECIEYEYYYDKTEGKVRIMFTKDDMPYTHGKMENMKMNFIYLIFHYIMEVLPMRYGNMVLQITIG